MHVKILMRFQKPLVPIKYVKQLSWLCGLWAAHDIDIIELLQTKKIGDSIFCTVYKSIYFLSRYVFWLLVRNIDKMRFLSKIKNSMKTIFSKKEYVKFEVISSLELKEMYVQIMKGTKCALCDKSPIFYFMGRGVKSKQRTVANSNLIQLSHFWRVAKNSVWCPLIFQSVFLKH